MSSTHGTHPVGRHPYIPFARYLFMICEQEGGSLNWLVEVEFINGKICRKALSFELPEGYLLPQPLPTSQPPPTKHGIYKYTPNISWPVSTLECEISSPSSGTPFVRDLILPGLMPEAFVVYFSFLFPLIELDMERYCTGCVLLSSV